MVNQFESLYEMMSVLVDEQACVDYLRNIRWKNGAFCPHCGCTRIYHFSDQRNHKCADCRKRFSIRVGTIFEDSKLPLRKWFMAIFLITSHKKGIASTQLAKDVGITQKTAWFVLHRLRYATRTKSFNRPLAGIVEADETYVGGKEKNKHKSKRTPGRQGGVGKIAVFGMLERNGEFRAKKIPHVDGKTVKGEIVQNVAPDAIVMTDEFRGYKGLESRYHHRSVNHSRGQYVKWSYIHTNCIEGAWAHFKRQVIGVHHWISKNHIQRYLDEFTWRWNRREMDEGHRVNDMLSEVSGRLTYKELISWEKS